MIFHFNCWQGTPFHQDLEMIFTYFAYPKINLDYIQTLLQHESCNVALYCFDDQFDIRNCPSCMIYHKEDNIYYITMICTHRKFRGLGYATMLLEGFIKKIRIAGNVSSFDKSYVLRIVLSALDDVVSYYQKIGFEVVDCDLAEYPGLSRFEKQDDSKMYSVMELTI
jgi:ribosomal protein S18 acetylase RimI-like enzyme